MSRPISKLLLVLFIKLYFICLVDGTLARPLPVVTQQVIVEPFADYITIVGRDLGGRGSKVVILLGSGETVCQSTISGQLNYLIQNTTILCKGFIYDIDIVTHLEAQDINITVDGTTYVSQQMLLYTHSNTSCMGRLASGYCGNKDVCSYGVCQCQANYVGPLCNLDPITSTTYQRNLYQPQFKYIYQSGLLEWNINFNKLNVWSEEAGKYVLLKDLTTEVTWNLTDLGNDKYLYLSSSIDTTSGVGNVQVTMTFINSNPELIVGDYTSKMYPNMLEFSVELMNLPDSFNKPYQIGYKIDTNYSVECDSQEISYFSYDYFNDMSDIRWYIFTKNSASMYGRHSSRCIADDGKIVQTCMLDLSENPIEQNIGTTQFFINYPIFNNNSQTWFDLFIVNYTGFPGGEKPICRESLPTPQTVAWFLPSILSLASLCLCSFIFVVVFFFKDKTIHSNLESHFHLIYK